MYREQTHIEKVWLISIFVCFIFVFALLNSCSQIHKAVMPGVDNVQFGMASWYGGEFQDCSTASGEEYDMQEFTAAHRTLPFGTLVRICNPKNKKAVVVRINDRGPWKAGRIIDLSYAAAKKIGILRAGVARVSLEVVNEETTVLASWYGKRFHGKPTASGEKFNMYGLTAAHRTLPFGTMVRVTNVENDQTVTVRINDRTPKSQETSINLSKRAAEQIGMMKSGTIRVKMEVAKPEDVASNSLDYSARIE